MSELLVVLKKLTQCLDFSKIKINNHCAAVSNSTSLLDLSFKNSSEIKDKIKNNEILEFSSTLSHFNASPKYILEIEKKVSTKFNSIDCFKSIFLEKYFTTQHKILLHTDNVPDYLDPLLLDVGESLRSDFFYALEVDPLVVKKEYPDVFIPLDLFSNDISILLSNFQNIQSNLIPITQISEYVY